MHEDLISHERIADEKEMTDLSAVVVAAAAAGV